MIPPTPQQRKDRHPLEVRTRLRLQGEGRMARYIEQPKSRCPYHSKAMKQAWLEGWNEMDMYLNEQEPIDR